MSTSFHHGISTVLIPDQAPPVRTAKTSIVGMVVTAGKGPVNVPVLIAGSRRKAIDTFGVWRKDGFTAPESFEAMFDQGSVTVVAVNVCDPEVHNEDVEGENVTLNVKTHKAVCEKPYHRSLTLSSTAEVSKTFVEDTIAIPDYLTVAGVRIGGTEYDEAVKQSKSITVTNAVTGNGNLAVTVTSAGMTGSGVANNVAVLNGDSAVVAAGKIRVALAGIAPINDRFTIGGTGAEIILTRKVPAANDATMAFAAAVGTATGFLAAGGASVDGALNDYYVNDDNEIIRSAGSDIPEDATVVVSYTYGPGFDEGVDFVHDAENGTIVRPVTGSHILPGSTLNVDYNYVDPTKVDSNDIIGSVANQTATGIQALIACPGKVKVKPRLLLTPRFTETYSATTANAVITELSRAAGVLGGRAIVDAPQLDRDSAIVHGSFFTGEESRVYMHYPYDIVRDPVIADATIEMPAAARIAGHMAVLDNKEGFWNSASNREIKGVLGISKDLTFAENDSETDVDLLNAAGIATTVFSTGFRLWGNRQTNMQHLSVQRISDMITESVAVAHVWAVDRNITTGLVEQVIESIRAYLRQLESLGALVPNPAPDQEQFNDAWADPELNTPEAIAEGNLFIDYRFNPPFPAEHIHFRAHITRKYISAIFVSSSNQ